MIGQTLSHFEITGKLGEGGMGIVYQAHDSVLDRDVAIKVLPEGLANDPDRLARLRREAKVLASLNHPNIAAIYSFETASPTGGTKERIPGGEVEPVAFLVMELVDGETASDLIAKGPIPVERSLEMAHQVCRALEAAHECGIVHRDLKPANIKIDASGRVKVLDFGLAKALASIESGADEDIVASASPTLTADMTEQGAVLGTAAYMSPEQAVGNAVDKRSDIWSFGCLLYEMLTGERAFRAPTNAETLASILKDAPNLDRLPNSADGAIAYLLKRCLQKDPLQRMRDIGEARILLEELRSGSVSFPTQRLSERSRALIWVPWLVAVAVVLVATFAFLKQDAIETSIQPGVKKLAIPLPDEAPFLPVERSALAISPDGSRVVFVGGSKSDFRLYSRDLAKSEVVALEQTRGGESPVFSPDGAWITFASNVSLRNIPVTGGSAQDLTFAPPVTRGFEWHGDKAILMTPNKASGLFEISLNDRTFKELTRRGNELLSGHCWPQLLPGGTQVLAASLPANVTSWDGAVILLLDLGAGTSRKLIEGGSFPRYVPTGHIVFARDGSLLANPFDISTGRLLGSSTVVVPDLLTDPTSGVAHFAFSNDGTLVYARGSSRPSSMRDLVWVDRNGIKERITSESKAYAYPRLSPSGEQVLMTIEGATDNVWTFDLDRGVLQRVTISGRQMT
ncbi:MAG: protein kinase, partial [Acidobacteriota bacterium]